VCVGELDLGGVWILKGGEEEEGGVRKY